VVDRPAFDTKKLGDLAITIATILLGQPDQGQTQFIVIILFDGFVAECAAGQADRFAGSSFPRIQLLTNMGHSLTQIGNRQTLGFK